MSEEVRDLAKTAREVLKKAEQKIGPVSTAASTSGPAGEAVAYIGPPLKQIIEGGKVFKNGYPVKVQECLNRYPFLGGLFVPVSGLAEARKEVRQSGTSLHVLYGEAEKIGGRTNV